MKAVKLIVIYPTPTDVTLFERLYANEHVPMAVAKLAGKTRFVASLITSSPGKEQAPYHPVSRKFISHPCGN